MSEKRIINRKMNYSQKSLFFFKFSLKKPGFIIYFISKPMIACHKCHLKAIIMS